MNYAVPVKYLILDTAQQSVQQLPHGDVWAEIAPFSIAGATDRKTLESHWSSDRSGGRLIVPAGEPVGHGPEISIDLAFGVWSERGKEMLEAGLRTLVDACRDRETELMIWPQLGTLVSDIPGMLSVCRKHESVGIFLEPAALFPAGGQFRLADFVERMTEVLPVPGMRAVCLGSEDAVSGEADLAAFVPLAQSAAGLSKPIVLRGADHARAATILGLG